ncbi:uncharacterized protein TNCV_901991 [Trichonephila clavipes]|nr:uncharacterized protein TNCV_901991 [Trichonephila clavipes]
MAPRSPDMTPCDFWLWDYLNDNIYRERSSTLPDVKYSILCYVLDIPGDLLWSIVENLILRLQHIDELEGYHTDQFYSCYFIFLTFILMWHIKIDMRNTAPPTGGSLN